MRKYLKDGIGRSLCLVVMLMHSDALQEFFLQHRNLTWDAARNHCQVCFQDLATLTPDNFRLITPAPFSDSWIGLRRNSTSNSSLPWSRWAHGDPLTFQNWYPGWPVIKAPKPQTTCCSCSCTCPAATTTTAATWTSTGTEATLTPGTSDYFNSTSTSGTLTPGTSDYFNSTATSATLTPGTNGYFNFPGTEPPLTAAQCVKSPMLPPNVSEPEDGHIEDTCVAALSFGAWVERNCTDLLPFVCQDDRFEGEAKVLKVTHSTADLTWLPGPSNVSHYRVEVKGGVPRTELGLTAKIKGLTAGTRYSVQVFAVKCGRDLHPQEVSFYTQPHTVQNLNVTNVTATSVFLSWSKPATGNVESYVIKFGNDGYIHTETAEEEVTGLTTGTGYTFTVQSGVNNTSLLSEESSITAHTKPGNVSNLRVSEVTNISLLLHWTPPEGDVDVFRVEAVNDSNHRFFYKEVPRNRTRTEQSQKVTGLPTGTWITLTVESLAGTTAGDKVTEATFTAPGPVSNLKLETTHDSLTAEWLPPAGNSTFTVKLLSDGDEQTVTGLIRPNVTFEHLKTAVKYTVIVCTVSGGLLGPPTNASKFTLPRPPTDAELTYSSKSSLTFKWKPPVNSFGNRFRVNLTSQFWNYNKSDTVNTTTYTFLNLNSGTNYNFTVQTVTDEEESIPLNISKFTAAEERQIGLSMLCSSSQSLYCAEETTMERVFKELQAKFQLVFENHVVWKLERKKE